jgi:minimal PKS acyl carrier protein
VETKTFDIADLTRILTEAAGGGDDLDFSGDAADTGFEELGYDSIAMLETAGRIEREFGVRLDDSAVTDALTPRAMVDLVNSYLILSRLTGSLICLCIPTKQ